MQPLGKVQPAYPAGEVRWQGSSSPGLLQNFGASSGD